MHSGGGGSSTGGTSQHRRHQSVVPKNKKMETTRSLLGRTNVEYGVEWCAPSHELGVCCCLWTGEVRGFQCAVCRAYISNQQLRTYTAFSIARPPATRPRHLPENLKQPPLHALWARRTKNVVARRQPPKRPRAPVPVPPPPLTWVTPALSPANLALPASLPLYPQTVVPCILARHPTLVTYPSSLDHVKLPLTHSCQQCAVLMLRTISG